MKQLLSSSIPPIHIHGNESDDDGKRALGKHQTNADKYENGFCHPSLGIFRLVVVAPKTNEQQ